MPKRGAGMLGVLSTLDQSRPRIGRIAARNEDIFLFARTRQTYRGAHCPSIIRCGFIPMPALRLGMPPVIHWPPGILISTHHFTGHRVLEVVTTVVRVDVCESGAPANVVRGADAASRGTASWRAVSSVAATAGIVEVAAG